MAGTEREGSLTPRQSFYGLAQLPQDGERTPTQRSPNRSTSRESKYTYSAVSVAYVFRPNGSTVARASLFDTDRRRVFEFESRVTSPPGERDSIESKCRSLHDKVMSVMQDAKKRRANELRAGQRMKSSIDLSMSGVNMVPGSYVVVGNETVNSCQWTKAIVYQPVGTGKDALLFRVGVQADISNPHDLMEQAIDAAQVAAAQWTDSKSRKSGRDFGSSSQGEGTWIQLSDNSILRPATGPHSRLETDHKKQGTVNKLRQDLEQLLSDSEYVQTIKPWTSMSEPCPWD